MQRDVVANICLPVPVHLRVFSALPRVTVLYSLMQNASLTWVNEMDNGVVGYIFYFISLKNILANLFSLSSRFS